MKTKACILLAALMASACLSRANIVAYNLADDGDGVINCSNYGLNPQGEGNYSMEIYGDHNLWGSGHLLGYFTTDTETDPTLALTHSIDNDTGTDWGDYHVMVTMNKTFSFSGISVANAGWTYTYTGPTLVGSDWIGYIDYYAGTPVLAGGNLTFNFSVSFTGSVNFSEQLTPSPVPEPGTTALAVTGGLVLAGLAVRRRRVES